MSETTPIKKEELRVEDQNLENSSNMPCFPFSGFLSPILPPFFNPMIFPGLPSPIPVPPMEILKVEPSESTENSKPATDQNETICVACGTTQTPLWRRNSKGEFECNACNLYFRKNQCPRPKSLLQKCSRRRKRKEEPSDFFKRADEPLTKKPDVKQDFIQNLAQQQPIFANPIWPFLPWVNLPPMSNPFWSAVPFQNLPQTNLDNSEKN